MGSTEVAGATVRAMPVSLLFSKLSFARSDEFGAHCNGWIRRSLIPGPLVFAKTTVVVVNSAILCFANAIRLIATTVWALAQYFVHHGDTAHDETSNKQHQKDGNAPKDVRCRIEVIHKLENGRLRNKYASAEVNWAFSFVCDRATEVFALVFALYFKTDDVLVVTSA